MNETPAPGIEPGSPEGPRVPVLCNNHYAIRAYSLIDKKKYIKLTFGNNFYHVRINLLCDIFRIS